MSISCEEQLRSTPAADEGCSSKSSPCRTGPASRGSPPRVPRRFLPVELRSLFSSLCGVPWCSRRAAARRTLRYGKRQTCCRDLWLDRLLGRVAVVRTQQLGLRNWQHLSVPDTLSCCWKAQRPATHPAHKTQ